MNKSQSSYKTIGEVCKMLGLIDKKKGTLSTHTIRYWEKEFKQIKPKIFSGKRRYYDEDSIKIIKNIQYHLKVKGMTIKGVKTLLNEDLRNKLDVDTINNVNKSSFNKDKILNKIKKINNILKEIKKNNG